MCSIISVTQYDYKNTILNPKYIANLKIQYNYSNNHYIPELLKVNSGGMVLIFWLSTQTSQLSRFGRETHDFLTDLTTACQSHDFSPFSRNIILLCV